MLYLSDTASFGIQTVDIQAKEVWVESSRYTVLTFSILESAGNSKVKKDLVTNST